ncbi:hypothetical protein E4U11_002034 [Claviceps purpurea]|nr:hypothetical protein E4U11_002034 [Claviceps purpurea]
MVASSNFGNVFSMLAAAAWLPFTRTMSIQLLAQNLLYDISQIAIPWDSVDPEYLKTPRSWKTWGISDSHNLYRLNDHNDPSLTIFSRLLTQTLIVHLLRTAKMPFIQSRAALSPALSTGAMMVIGFAITWIPPIQRALNFAQPSPTFVGFLVAEREAHTPNSVRLLSCDIGP